MDNHNAKWLWMFQAVSGIALILLLGLHWFAQHYLGSDGLRNYAEVAYYLKQPVVCIIELTFLIVVTGHGLIGARSIIVDLGLRMELQRLLDIALWFIGILTLMYGFQLVWQIIHQ